jgi:cysteine desulfurase/selenocysteine lyase
MALHRDLFPVTQQFAFLNNAAESPLNTATHARLAEYLACTLTAPHTKPATVRQQVREHLAALLGGLPEDFALMSGTSQGLNTVAAGVAWEAGDNVVLPEGEHWNNAFPWFALRERGVEVRVAPLAADGAVLPESIEALVDHRTRLVTTAHVQFATGHRCDIPRLAAIAHRKGALLVVDGIQGAGCCPLNLAADGVDVYAAGGFKWLLGAPGTGFLYISKAARARVRPTLPGMFAGGPALTELVLHGDARQYEGGSIAYALFHGWTAGLALLREVGVGAIFERNQRLTGLLLRGLEGKPHLRLLSPVADPAARSQIVVVTAGSPERNRELCDKLLAQGVVVANRADSVRISPNFYNTEEEIARLLELL